MRIFAILLMVVALWYGVEFFSSGMGDSAPAAAPLEQARQGTRPDQRTGSSRPPPITRRVHDRVTAAMDQSARRAEGR
jgi:hypothetical protein